MNQIKVMELLVVQSPVQVVYVLEQRHFRPSHRVRITAPRIEFGGINIDGNGSNHFDESVSQKRLCGINQIIGMDL